MSSDVLPLQPLVAALIRSSRSFRRSDRAIIRAAYPLLARGEPVSMDELAHEAGVPGPAVADAFTRWPGLGRLDAAGRLHAFLGLSLEPTPYRFDIGGRTLFAWCAWDSLFIPLLLGRTARVSSACAVSGAAISLSATPGGVCDVRPDGVAMALSTVACETDGCSGTGVSCDATRYIESASAGWWIERHPDARVLSLAEAWQLGWLFVTVCLGGAGDAARMEGATG